MESLEISAKTVEEAIERALDELGLNRDEVKITVLKEGRAGIMGFGSEDAKVRVEPLVEAAVPSVETPPASVEPSKSVLETLLAKMDVVATVEARVEPPAEGEDRGPTVILNIKGEDVGILIGRHGQTLGCLQYIVGLIVSHQTQNRQPIMVDAEGYKQRRFESLQAMATRAAERVKLRRIPYTLRPMSAAERRIVHIALANDPEVTTESTGEGEARRVVISPRRLGSSYR